MLVWRSLLLLGLWGLIGVSVALSVCTCTIVSLILIGTARLLRLSPRDLFGGLVTPGAASVPMVAAMLLFQHAVNIVAAREAARIALLIADVLLGAAIYTAVLGVIDPPRRRAAAGVAVRILARIRTGRPRRSAAERQ